MIRREPSFSENDCFFITETTAKDGHAAIRKVIGGQTRRAATSVILDKGFEIRTRPYAFFTSENKEYHDSRASIVMTPDRHIQEPSPTLTRSQADRLVDTSQKLLSSFGDDARRQIIGANEIVALIRSAESSETQLALTWSAFETLIGDPLESQSRFSHFADIIVPVVCLNYPWRCCDALYLQILLHHRRTALDALAGAGLAKGDDDLLSFQRFIFYPEYQHLHRSFLGSLSNNPLIRFNLFQLHKKFYDPRRARRSIEAHEKRVRWQLQRIYRIRNDFIHAGKKFGSTRSVGLNGFEYYRTFVSALTYHGADIVGSGIVERQKNTLDYCIESMRLAYKVRLRMIEDAATSECGEISSVFDVMRRV